MDEFPLGARRAPPPGMRSGRAEIGTILLRIYQLECKKAASASDAAARQDARRSGNLKAGCGKPPRRCGMMVGKRAWLVVAGTLLVAGLAGCGNFWQKPGSGSTSFSLSNSGTIVVNPGATSGNTAVITVSPSSSFTGTVALSCSVTAPSGASNPATCSLSPTSVSISNSSAQTSTMTATTQSGTTLGNYTATVTGT